MNSNTVVNAEQKKEQLFKPRIQVDSLEFYMIPIDHMIEIMTFLLAPPKELIIKYNGTDHALIYKDENSWTSLCKLIATQTKIKKIKFNLQFINKHLANTLLKYLKKEDLNQRV